MIEIRILIAETGECEMQLAMHDKTCAATTEEIKFQEQIFAAVDRVMDERIAEHGGTVIRRDYPKQT